MARPLSWSDVRGGAVIAAALLVVGFLVLKFSRLGTLHGETFLVTAFVGEARGVLPGSEVWLSGQKVGKIIAIRFRPPDSDSLERIQVDMELLEKYRAAIREDAVAQIRNGGTVIGAPVVWLTAGTPAARELRAGDTIRSKPQTDLDAATGKFGAVTQELPAIAKNVKELASLVSGTNGSVGAFLNDSPGRGSLGLERTRAEWARLNAKLASPGGSVNEKAREDVMRRAQRVMSRVDSLRTLMSSSRSSFGRMRRDSTLIVEATQVRNELDTVGVMLADSRGTAGRALHDSALVVSVGDARRQMAELVGDMKKHPLRYIRF